MIPRYFCRVDDGKYSTYFGRPPTVVELHGDEARAQFKTEIATLDAAANERGYAYIDGYGRRFGKEGTSVLYTFFVTASQLENILGGRRIVNGAIDPTISTVDSWIYA